MSEAATLQRAYSTFEIRAVQEDERVIEGIASTPSTDRYGDIVEPKGAEFTLPIPLLWQHRGDQPVGRVVAAKITDEGILIRAQIEQDDEPGPLKDLLDMAWRATKKKLVRGLSIGFSPIESTDIDGTWGRRFIRWDWLELSLVTIPANADATIQTVKNFAANPAPSGTEGKSRSPAVAVPINPKNSGRTPVTQTLNIAEQIKSAEASRAAKAARMTEIQAAAAAAGTTKDAAQQEEFDTLADEIRSIDKEITDLRVLEKLNVAKAAPVTPNPIETDAPAQRSSEARGGTAVVLPKQLPPGVAFARLARVLGVAAKKNRDVEVVARQLYPDDDRIQKAAVAAGTTSGGTWAGPLVSDEGGVFADFAEFLRPQTIIGKFGTDGIPSLRAVPFRAPLLGQTSGGQGYWVGEGKAKGLTKFDFSRTSLEPLKVANIAVVTQELLNASSPKADILIRDGLAAALRERLDIDFVDPAKAASPDISPASITRSVVGIPSSGNTAEKIRNDFRAMVSTFIAADNPPSSGVVLMPATVALALSLMQNPLGQPEFPGLTMNGGRFLGFPVIVSEHIPTTSQGAIVVLVNADDIYFADEGGVTIDVSREASLEMATNPTQDATANPPVTANMISLWQANSVGFLAERTVNWAKRRTSAVALLEQVYWGQA